MPYTYLIGWSSKDKWYYGVRYAKASAPSELWDSYFTSSKYVKSFTEEHGQPDIIEIRKIFECPNKARKWEHLVLKRMNVVNDDRFLNQTDNVSISKETSLKGSLQSTNKGQKRPHLSELNKKKIGSLNPMYGKRGSEAPCYGRTGDKHPMYGKKNKKAAEVAKKLLVALIVVNKEMFLI